MKKKWLFALLAMALLTCVVGCGQENPSDLASVTPITESYEYTTIGRVYGHPALRTVERWTEYLSPSIDDGTFFCDTADTEQADEFINAQRTLLQFLRDSGVETAKLNYFAMNTDDSFSESDKKRAHIALSHVNSYQQVLITLQTLWSDYTDYGYIHAVANAIAEHLGWQTDAIEEVEQATLDAFFVENPDALNLLYPCFTTTYASEETVRNCYALSHQLFEKIDLRDALTKPVTEQVDAFRALVDAYAQEISVIFDRQENGYAYYGAYIPLKISTTYVQHLIDHDYDDYYRARQEERGDDSWDYFAEYSSIFATIDIINEEIARSLAHFELEEEAGLVVMNWLNEESSMERFSKPNGNYYYATYNNPVFDGTIYLTQIDAYLHEYFHHIDFLLSGDLTSIWQEQAFAELGSAQSQHARHVFDWPLLDHEGLGEGFGEVFYTLTGRAYQGTLDDYYDAYDLICASWESYELDYYTGGDEVNSFTHYLLTLYGEDTVTEIFLFPETVETATGKTWEVLQAEWQQQMEKRFEKLLNPDDTQP